MSIRTYLYDADGSDKEVELDESVADHLSDRQLLWVDVSGNDPQEIERVGSLLHLHRESVRNLLNPVGRPRLDSYTDYFQINVVAIHEDRTHAPISLDFFSGPNYVVTVHPEAIEFLEHFNEQVRGETELGKLTSDAFLAALLDWHIASYFHAIDALEEEVDHLDQEILAHPAERRFLAELAGYRRKIGQLRRRLAPHRDVFAALGRADFEAIASTESAAHFRTLNERFESAMEAIEHGRELIVGSFELYATGTDLRTNDIVRILTIATVVTAIAGVIAGIMGMNFQLDFFQSGMAGFLEVIGAIVLLSAGILAFSWWRNWL